MSDAVIKKMFAAEELFYQDLNDQNDEFVARINERVESADCVSTNTPNKVVKRDESGNFAAGTITATLNGNATNGVPVGAVLAFAHTTAPAGWLECNGQAVSRTIYSALFSAIGTTFGSGDGSTTFNLPELRGEFIRGWDHLRGIDLDRGFGSAQGDGLKSHTHNVVKANYDTGTSGGVGAATGIVLDERVPSYDVSFPFLSNTGGTETRPRNIALMYCIKY